MFSLGNNKAHNSDQHFMNIYLNLPTKNKNTNRNKPTREHFNYAFRLQMIISDIGVMNIERKF